MTSLRRKIGFGFYAFTAGIAAIAAIAYLDLRFLADRIEKGVVIESFLDASLEMRRYVKNYFLYRDEQDREQAAGFAKKAASLLTQNPEMFSTLMDQAQRTQLERWLAHYRQLLAEYGNAERPAQSAIRASELRNTGYRIVEQAESLSREERRWLKRSLGRAGTYLLIALAAVAALGAFIARRLSRAVVWPLTQLEAGLESIGEGRFDHIEPVTQDREIVSVSLAVNRMLGELDLRQRRLRQSEKLAALGTLVAGVAHELNNPLSNISTSTELATENLDRSPHDRLRTWLAQIDSETERARHIVRSLLDFSHEHPLQPVVAGLAELVTSAAGLLKERMVREAAVLVVRIPADLTVQADVQGLRQIFVNLLQNAMDAKPEGLRIEVSAWRTSGADALATCEKCHFARVADAALTAREVVVVQIIDNGPGMPGEILKNVFDPFFSTRDVGHGSGLGLYIAQEIVHRHDGMIGVASEPGFGARFSIILPTSSASASA